jgi:hypothetical protein
MQIVKEPTGEDRGLSKLTSRFYGNSLLDAKFSVNNSIWFITRRGRGDDPADFRFLDRSLQYLEDGARYYVEVVARCFRDSKEPSPDAWFLNVWLTLVAIRPLGSNEYQRIAEISKRELPSLLLLKDPPPPKEFLDNLEFGKLVEFPARITVGMPMMFKVAINEWKILNDVNPGGSR